MRLLTGCCTVGIAMVCLPLFRAGEAQTVTSIKVIQRTADVGYAATNDDFRFAISTPAATCNGSFPNLPSDERERGKTDTYSLNVSSCNLDKSLVTAQSFSIVTLGHNAWLPSNFCVQVTAGGTQSTIADGSWPTLDWFSTDPNDWPAPKHVHSSYNLSKVSGGGFCSGGTGSTPPASIVTITVRHWTYSTVGTPSCSGSVTVSGTLQSAASGATTGTTSFSHSSPWSGFATHWSGDQFYCDAVWYTPSLKAGTWAFGYQVPYGSGSNCPKNLPLPSSALGRINFTNGHVSCATGSTFP